MCLSGNRTASASQSSTFIAGIRLCHQALIYDSPCWSTSTTMIISKSRGRIELQRQNDTITSWEGLESPSPYPIPVRDFFRAYTAPLAYSRVDFSIIKHHGELESSVFLDGETNASSSPVADEFVDWLV
jgi:hypothetical protein